MKLWFKRGAWARARAVRLLETLSPSDIRSVAVIRHAALGDMVLTRPFLVELRRLFPAASITLSLASKYTRGAPRDLVDRVHVASDGTAGVSLGRQYRSMKALGAHDLLFDLAATSRSFWLCMLTPARIKLGFPYGALRRLHYDVTVPRSDLRFEAENMLDLLMALGHACAHPPDFAMRCDPAIAERPRVVYFPGASTPDKCWPPASFSDLIGRMSRLYPGHDHVVLRGRADWESVDDIVAPLVDRINVRALGLDDLDETVALLAGARLLIGNDTGIRHIAIACGTPTVGIFFRTEVFRYWPRFGPHEVAFVPDGSMPGVDQVCALGMKLLAGEDMGEGPARPVRSTGFPPGVASPPTRDGG